MLEKLVRVTIATCEAMYNLERSEQLFFNVESCSCLRDFSLTGGQLKSGRSLHLRGSLMDLVGWTSLSSTYA